MTQTTRYPDVSDIIVKKAQGRRGAAARTFAEKLDMLERLRERVRPFRDARHARTIDQAVKNLRSEEQT